MYYILVCLSKVFQRTIFLSGSRFSGKAFAKVRRFFVTSKFFSKVFFEKIFGRFSEGVRLTLSRSLAHPQGKILGAAVSTIFRSLSSSSLSSSAALPLESGCKGTDFFRFRNFYTILFFNIFSDSCITRWFTLCYKAYFFIVVRKRMWNPPHYIIRAGAYVCARKEKGMVLTEMKGFSGTYSAFKKTQVHLI